MSDHSYAFRKPKIGNNGKTIPIQHHDAVQQIINYKKQSNNVPLYVAECDIKKFYDTINHKIIIKCLIKFILKCLIKKKIVPNLFALIVFLKYLNSFSFYDDVYRKNEDINHFKRKGIQNGYYKWVEKDLKEIYKHKSIYKEKIGVPQGGALSGLIANIVLDCVDKEVAKHADEKLIYLRYCDDMILIHPDKEICQKVFHAYQKKIAKLKLAMHKPASISIDNPKEFWQPKSKGPYCWHKDHFKWISFVGYDLHIQGSIRVRKASMEKELLKQKRIVDNVISAICKKNSRKSSNQIIESTQQKLIGMAVGRFDLYNYKTCPKKLCWANGFKLLDNNSYVRHQMRVLDRNRNLQIHRLKRFLEKREKPTPNPDPKTRQKKYFGKPFSYYSIIDNEITDTEVSSGD